MKSVKSSEGSTLMSQYEITFTDEAKADLHDLDNYITFELLSPETADNFITRILDNIDTLVNLPNRHPFVPEEPWHSRGLRQWALYGFKILYLVFDEDREVYIQNVICEKRDLPRVLRKLYPEFF